MINRLVTAFMRSDIDEPKLRLRLRLITALSFVATMLVGGSLAALAIHVHVLTHQKDVEIIAVNQGAILEERLSRSLSSTYALAAALRQGAGQINDFEQLARELLQHYGGIRTLQLAKNGVVTQTWPLSGNEKVIGHDVFGDPEHNKDAFTAVLTHRLTMAGPVELVQGGLGVVGRLPIYLPRKDAEDYFWGFAAAVINVPDLLATTGLSRLRESNHYYELAHLPAGAEHPLVFARSGTEPLHSPIVRQIEVPDGKWLLRIEPANGWINPVLPLGAGAIVLLLAVAISALTYTTFKQPLVLHRTVQIRTKDLAETNRILSIEIEKRERAQREVIHINRLYSVLSHTNGAIVRISERHALLEEICRVAVEHGGFPLARIALLAPDDKRCLWNHQEGDGSELPPCDNRILDCYAAKMTSMQNTAIRVCSTLHESHPGWFPLCQEAISVGFESHVILLLHLRGRPVGVFSLYAREPDYFDAAQLRLLEEMTKDVSFALENIEREEMRKRVEQNLRKLSRAVEQSANAVIITDRHGIIEYVNPWFTRITGYTQEDVVGKTPQLLKSAETHPETYKRLWDTIVSGKEWTGELHNTKKNGDLYWCLETISPLKNEAGEITHYVAVTEDISERKQNEQTIRHLAFHDPLTGLPNRRLFNDRLHQATVSRQRRANPFALMLLDLDRFKTVNDTLGHDVGDALLKAVTSRLAGMLRQGDTLARMGGDEFAVLALDITQPESVVHIAEKLLEELKQPFHLYGHELYVTTSIGVTLFPNDATDVDALVKNADIALYRAKDSGRNNYQFFTSDMNASMMHRLQLESSMRWAIERGEFMLHYQPQVDIVTGKIHGTEALIRWRHPELGMVSPAKFIPLAEETGMIVEIGKWILRTACAQAKAWEQAGVPTRVAVNLSARQFHQGDLAETIDQILQEFDLPPSLLELELTEGILMEDTAQTAASLDQLHKMGMLISIDDFGTGYSSLSYLKRLPIQILKIDQSFVRDISTDADDRAIVMAVIALAHSMKLKVVAEGVETREQLAFLRQYACDAMQGYLFSRPVPGDEVLALLLADQRLSA